MKKVRIYPHAKTAMQSGRAKTGTWILEYERLGARRPEPLMGWTAAPDTFNQIRLKFPAKEDALRFAEQRGWEYELQDSHIKRITPRNYADNFKYVPIEDQSMTDPRKTKKPSKTVP